VHPLVSPAQFLEDDYYMGGSLRHLSPVWKQEFIDVFSPSSTYGTLILTGAIGCGKTTFAAACFTRKLYELSCLKDAAHFHGLLPKSKIVFGIYNITLEKADDTVGLVEQFVKDSPYFQKECPLRDRPRFPLYFPTKRLEIAVGSLGAHALGDNVLCFLVDETNFFKKLANTDIASEKTRAHQLFNEARSRQVSRFMRSGRVPGLNILISSKKYHSSFLDQFIEKVDADPELKRMTKVICLALWQAKRPEDFSGESFDVLVGTEHYPSRVLEYDELVPDGADTVKVPVEYREQFVMDPDLALRDIAGLSTTGSTSFFPVKQKLMNCVDYARVHPFTTPEITIPLGKDRTIAEFLDERKLCKINRSVWLPLVNPAIERHIHIDLAVSGECIGITMACPCTLPDARLGVWVDFMLRIRPPTVGELELGSVVEFCKHLRDVLHFKIKKITFDQWQSRMPIQLLVQAGFTAEQLSVDLAHYTHLKTCVNESRLVMYEYAPFIGEADALQKDPLGRPHHPVGGLDDVCDSVAGVVSRCYNIESARTKKGSPKKDVVRTSVGQSPIVLRVNTSHGQEEYRSS